jgi:RTX calcium-binding nonapeptide repeat (4 copies)
MSRRALWVVLVTGVLVALLPIAPARSAPTKVSWPVSVNVKAAAGTENHVWISYVYLQDLLRGGTWIHLVSDSAGVTTVVTEPPTCRPLPLADASHGRWVECPDGTSFDGEPGSTQRPPKGQGETFTVSLGDLNDTFTGNSVGEFRVRGGPGRDLLAGGREPSIVPAMEDEPRVIYWPEDFLQGDSGNDVLAGREGPDNIWGGPGADFLEGGPLGAPVGEESPGFNTGKDDTLVGGPGNDKIDAFDQDRDTAIFCGPGRRDRAWIDRIDPKPRGCEIVKKRAPRRSELRDVIDALCKLGNVCDVARRGG